MALLTLLKGLPMTYNRDLQEDKERLFDSADHVRATVRIMTALLAHTHVDEAACLAAASDPALLATDIADYLVNKGMPFRQAHHKVGQAVALAEKQGKPLTQLTLPEYQAIDPLFSADIHRVFDLAEAMKKRTLPGSPGTREVAGQLTKWQKHLSRIK
jgi:argininosuccinate lyase